jgi:transposase
LTISLDEKFSLYLFSLVRGMATKPRKENTIFRLKKEGMKHTEIAKIVHIKKQTVCTIIKKGMYKIYVPRTGRPRIETEQKMRLIKKILRAHRQKGVRALTAEAKCNWSKSTTHQRLMGAGWKNMKVRRRPVLSEKQKEERMTFARTHLVEKTDFDIVVFSDEKKFRFDAPDVWHKYWIELGEPPVLDCFSRDYGHYKGVMVWMALSSAGIVHIERVEGKLDAERYATMLTGDACAAMHAAHGTDFVLQQDNAPPHRAASTLAVFQEAGIRTLPWPALSPDLNPVENVWSLLARRVYADGRHYDSEHALWNAVQTVAKLIPVETVRDLVHGVPHRLTALLERHGEYVQ